MEEAVKFLALDYQSQTKLYKYVEVPGDGNCFFHALCNTDRFKGYKHLQLRRKYISDMRSYKLFHPEKYNAFADFILKRTGSTLNLRLDRIANVPNSWGSWIEATAMMLIWDVDIIIHIPGRRNRKGDVKELTMEESLIFWMLWK
jgi:hypothetical protein